MGLMEKPWKVKGPMDRKLVAKLICLPLRGVHWEIENILDEMLWR